ncbi:hypothetical protein SDC9_112272 [bioreactor metagenome]|uniref:Uncharacterized protein n=1 Tax=bioreactor metagenome TaxID=1076179 RepID=A0A645BJJ0_9ZZZZ
MMINNLIFDLVALVDDLMCKANPVIAFEKGNKTGCIHRQITDKQIGRVRYIGLRKIIVH